MLPQIHHFTVYECNMSCGFPTLCHMPVGHTPAIPPHGSDRAYSMEKMAGCEYLNTSSCCFQLSLGL